MSLNKAILMGRLTKDPELRHTDSGKAVCSFSIAVDNGYGEDKKTDFISCVAWNKTAEFVSKYFAKGKMIIVIGRISTRSWEGQDGKKNYATEVIASEVFFGESKLHQSPSEADFDGKRSGNEVNELFGKAENEWSEVCCDEDDEFVPIDDYDDMPF